MNWAVVIYPVIIIGVGVLIIWAIWRKIREAEAKRKKRLKKLEEFDPVATESPVDNHIKKARKRGLHNVEVRFNIFRKLLIPVILLIVGLMVIIPFLDTLPSTILSLVIATITVIVGIAARPLVENLICGIVISFGRLIRVGDTVMVDDRYGTVEDISMTHITIKKWDWRRYIIPNSQMLNKAFLNYTIYDSYRWTPVKFTVSHDVDINKVERISIEAIKKSSHYDAEHEEPRFWVMGMDKDCAQCMVVGWADTPADSWLLSTDTRKEIVKQFKKHNIKPHCLIYNRDSNYPDNHEKSEQHNYNIQGQ
jgi:small-conductance mechanosensitive channel